MISPQFIVEDALAGLLTPITGLNVYISNRRGARFFPYVTIRAQIGSQLIVPTSGVFEIPVELSYSDSAVRTTQATFESNYFDLVISINTIHNLVLEDCKKSIQEIMRVSKKNSFLVVDAYRNKQEKENIYAWNLTAQTILSTDEWKELFLSLDYKGDYYWFIP